MNIYNLRSLLSIQDGEAQGDISSLIHEGLVIIDQDGSTNITEKGRVFINALMSVPLPIQAWTMPGKQ
jgi:predicted transcriptional regulator